MITRVGPYVVDERLGRGGMGEVYKVHNDTTEEVAALKVILPNYAMIKEASVKFLREIETSMALDHQNVIAVKETGYLASEDEAGQVGQVLYYTMEYCNGGSIAAMLDKTGRPLPASEAVALILQALDGLDYAHNVALPVRLEDGRIVRARGLVHRDVKPQNLFLVSDGATVIVKIGDFGLAKAFETAGLSGFTATGGVGGTPEFMPLQQAIDFKYARPEVDVWAMAASLYVMLTGVLPRKFPKGQDRFGVVLKSDAIPIRERNPLLPPGLAKVIDEALVDRPTIQVSTAKAFRQMLEGAL